MRSSGSPCRWGCPQPPPLGRPPAAAGICGSRPLLPPSAAGPSGRSSYPWLPAPLSSLSGPACPSPRASQHRESCSIHGALRAVCSACKVPAAIRTRLRYASTTTGRLFAGSISQCSWFFLGVLTVRLEVHIIDVVNAAGSVHDAVIQLLPSVSWQPQGHDKLLQVLPALAQQHCDAACTTQQRIQSP